MPAIPTPDRGQPIDVTYLYQITNAINEISNQISPATYNYTNIDVRDVGNQQIQTRAAKIVGGIKDIVANESVTAGQVKTFTYTYSGDFKYPPIATITPINILGNDIGDDVLVTIRSIDTTSITFAIKFNKSGNANISVNILAIGIPR